MLEQIESKIKRVEAEIKYFKKYYSNSDLSYLYAKLNYLKEEKKRVTRLKNIYCSV